MLKKFYNVLDKSTTAIKHEESVAQKLFQCIDTLEDITYNTIEACNEGILPQVSPPSKIQSIYSSFRNRLCRIVCIQDFYDKHTKILDAFLYPGKDASKIPDNDQAKDSDPSPAHVDPGLVTVVADDSSGIQVEVESSQRGRHWSGPLYLAENEVRPSSVLLYDFMQMKSDSPSHF